MKIVIIPNKTFYLEKGVIDSETNLLIIPKSLKIIRSQAIRLDEIKPDSIWYLGTIDEFKKVTIEEGNAITCVNCIDGQYIVAL